MHRLIRIAPVLLALCGCGGAVPRNSGETSAVLDLLSPGYRFGETLAALERGGELTEVDASEYGTASARLRLASPRMGFVGVRIFLHQPRPDAGKGEMRATSFVFYTSPERDQPPALDAAARHTEALTHVLGRPPRAGCAGGAYEERVYYWETPRGGGVALFVPPEPRRWPFRIDVYPPGKRVRDVAMQFRAEPCR